VTIAIIAFTFLVLVIVNNSIINVYNDGTKVVLFKGIIKYARNDDELALIIGHEVAHRMLRHVYYKDFRRSDYEISVAKGNADKLGGAIYYESWV
jgi:predicted Zn-dependent protease